MPREAEEAASGGGIAFRDRAVPGASAVRGEAFAPVPNRGMITFSIMLANIMQGVDNTILNVALPHVQGSLSASLDQIAWALTSYIVCAAIMMPYRLARRPVRHQIYLPGLGHRLHAHLGAVRRRHEPGRTRLLSRGAGGGGGRA